MAKRGRKPTLVDPMEIREAIEREDVEEVRRLVTAGGHVNAVEEADDTTPLMWAAAKGNLQIVKLLVEGGADVNGMVNAVGIDGVACAATFAAVDGHREVYDYLVKRTSKEALAITRAFDPYQKTKKGRRLDELVAACLKGDQQRVAEVLAAGPINLDGVSEREGCFTPLHAACYNNDAKIVRMLLDAGANANSKEHPLCAARTAEIAEMLREAGADPNGGAPLTAHPKGRELGVVRVLLAHGADPNGVGPYKGQRPLHGATDAEMQLLLDAGADVDAADQEGTTPLMLAARSGLVRQIALLLDHGADVHRRDHAGCDALLHAATLGHVQAVSLLLQRGANPNSADGKGNTALYYTVRRCYRGRYHRCVQALLQAGADVNARNANGQTAIMEAIHWGWADTAEMLLAHGADPTLANSDGRTAVDHAWRPQLLSLGHGPGGENLPRLKHLLSSAARPSTRKHT